jgi:hypothetical protein
MPEEKETHHSLRELLTVFVLMGLTPHAPPDVPKPPQMVQVGDIGRTPIAPQGQGYVAWGQRVGTTTNLPKRASHLR